MKKIYLFLLTFLTALLSFGQLPSLPLDFESATVNYTFTDFDGGATTKIANPQINGINTSANVARMVKSAGNTWGGSWIQLAAPIDFSVNKTFKVKVYSPRIGAKLLLKVENASNGAIFFEKEATSTVANAWEDLTFDYSTINTANSYQKLVFIFDNGTMGDGTANFTFLFDDVRLISGGGGGGLTQMNLPVTFDDATVNYGLVGFGGAEQSTIVTDPTLATNKVAKVIKTNTAELWAGTTVTALNGTVQTGFSSNIPFAAGATKMNVRVWSPHAGIQVRLKAEDKNDPNKSCETEATVTVASGWQTLEFNFANQAAGTAALNFATAYNKVSIFFNFGVTGATAGERTYYFDDVKFGAATGGGGLTQMNLPVTFDDATVNYGLVGFGGAEQSTIVTDPTLATNKVAKVIKTNTAELWAGTTVTALNGTIQTGFASNIPFAAGATKMNVRVWSPHAGIQVRLKAEDKNDPNKSCETEATVTVASGWQTLEFNFANQAAGTAALNFATAYNKLSIFFNFGVTGATAGERTYYFDDVKFGAATGGGGSTLPVLPLDFESATLNYTFTDFDGGGTTKIANTQINGINTSANVARMIKSTGQVWGGSWIELAAPIDFSVNKTFKVKVYSPRVGAKLLLKVENATNPALNFEKEATSTVANAWEELTFDYSTINTANQYSKLVFIFDNGTMGNGTANYTWLFDEVRLVASGGGGGLTQMNLPVTFDDVTVNYGLVGFGGAEQSTIVTDPTLATNKVAKVIKTNTAELWAGTTVTALNGTVQTGFSSNIPFAAGATKMNVRVWSPHAGIQVRLKAEDKNDPNKSCETEATVTVASGWQTLEFNFANQAAGTAALNFATAYNKVSIFFNFGVTGATAGERTYYFDDVKFGAATGGGGLTQMNLPVTFDDATVNYGLVGFGGAEQSTIVTDPTLATNKVAKVIKTNTAELWAGTTVTALNGTVQTGFSSNIPFAAGATKMNVRVWSPHAGIQVRLKAEDKNDPNKSCETEATVTVASGWQTLEFNFANQAAGTAALNFATAYNKVSIFFNFGVTGATAGERTYYFDDVKFGAASGGGGSNLPVLPLDFESATLNYTFTDFDGGATTKIANPQINGINTSANVARMIKSTGQVWGGSWIELAAPMDFSVNKIFKVKVYSPRVGAKLLLKVENGTNPAIFYEKEATSTVANAWEELTFDFGTINTANQYSKLIFIFDNGTMGNGTANYTWLFDEVRLTTSGGPILTLPVLPLDFESTTVNYTFTNFDGGATAKIVNPQINGINTSANVAKMIKSAGQTWGGSWLQLAAPIDFTTNKIFKVKVFSPRVGAKLLLKAENEFNGAQFYELEAVSTVANAWEELTFDFSAINMANTYSKLIFIFDFGTMGNGSANFTWLFDDVRLTAASGPVLTQMNLPVTFDDATVNYGLIGFGGAEQSTIVTDPTLATNKVGKVIKTNTAELWAGTTISALLGTFQSSFSSNIPFTASATKMNVRVWSPHSGIQVRLKVEDKNDPTKSCETEATFTNAANTWQTLEFNFANQAPGTAALNVTYNLNKASIFFNFGITGATAGERTYYFDDVKFGAAAVTLAQMNLPVTFDATNIDYSLIGFGGAEQSTIVTDPTLATNKVAKVIKTNTAELWAGTTITALSGVTQTGFASNIPLNSCNTKMSVRVWSPHAGIKVRLKVEDKNDPAKSCETEATVTVASGWQTLEFNFANQAAGTAPLNFAFNYNKVSIFFNFGVTGAVAGERIYYFDDVQMGANNIPAVPGIASPVTYCQNAVAVALTATPAAGNSLRWYTAATGGTGSSTAPIPSTTTGGTIIYYVSQVTSGGCEGPRAAISVVVNSAPAAPATSPVTYCQNSTASALTATGATGNSFKWYTTATGGTGATTAPVPSTLTTGTTAYYVSQVTPQGCESSRTVLNVTINTTPAAPVVTSPVVYCLNDISQYLSATASTGNTLNWYTVATGGVASSNIPKPFTGIAGLTNYYVSQFNNLNCESPRAVIAVTVNALPTAPVIAAAPTTKLFPGSTTTISLTGTPVTGSSFSWLRNGLPVNAQNSSSILINIDKLGVYTLKLTNANNCSNLSNNVIIEEAENTKLFAYPNPSNGNFEVRYFSTPNNLEPRNLAIYNSQGRLVYKASYAMFGAYTAMPVNLKGLAGGYYTIYLMDKDGNKIKSTRVLITQ